MDAQINLSPASLATVFKSVPSLGLGGNSDVNKSVMATITKLVMTYDNHTTIRALIRL